MFGDAGDDAGRPGPNEVNSCNFEGGSYMSKKLWIKSAMLLAAGAALFHSGGLSLNEGCYREVAQRTIVGVLFD
jgi:hypothetical protein